MEDQLENPKDKTVNKELTRPRRTIRERLKKIVKRTAIACACIFGGCYLGGYYITQPAETSLEDQDNKRRPKNEEELLQILKQEFGYEVKIEVREADKKFIKVEKNKIAKKGKEPETARHEDKEKNETDEQTYCEYFSALYDWAINYQDPDGLKETDEDDEDDDKEYCNWHTRHGGDIWKEQYGVQAYYISTYNGKTWRSTANQNWHQELAVKVREGEYLIFDNAYDKKTGEIIYWYGPLDEYAQSKSMNLVPVVGITPVQKLKHDWSISRILAHLRYFIEEKDMKSLNLPKRTAQGQLADAT